VQDRDSNISPNLKMTHALFDAQAFIAYSPERAAGQPSPSKFHNIGNLVPFPKSYLCIL